MPLLEIHHLVAQSKLLWTTLCWAGFAAAFLFFLLDVIAAAFSEEVEWRIANTFTLVAWVGCLEVLHASELVMLPMGNELLNFIHTLLRYFPFMQLLLNDGISRLLNGQPWN